MSQPNKSVDLLHLADERVQQIRRELDIEDDRSKESARRASQRYSYIVPEGIAVEFEGGRAFPAFLVRPRNISESGMAFLHAGFVHQGTRCKVTLKALDNELVLIWATVRACRYVDGKIHHVGVEFESPINVVDFSMEAAQIEKAVASGPIGERSHSRLGSLPPSSELLQAARNLQLMSQAASQLIKQIHTRLVDFDNEFGTHLSESAK